MSLENNDNITLRRRRQLSKSKSIDSLNYDYSLDKTSQRSFDISTVINKNDLEEMKVEILQLKEQLFTTQNNLGELINENNKLKETIFQQQLQIDTLKDFCNTPMKSQRLQQRSARKRCRHSVTDSSRMLNLDQEQQTCNIESDCKTSKLTTLDTSFEEINNDIDKKTQQDSQTTKIINTRNRKLCILNNCNHNGTLEILENINFGQHFQYCHYLLRNSGINKLLSNISNKLQDFNMNDYCILMMGDQDLKDTGESIKIIGMIRETFTKIKHSNVIICCPTYIQGAPIHNYKIEMFNHLLYMDIVNHKYAYFVDSNCDLSSETFSYMTGKINKLGLERIYKGIYHRLLIDIKTYPIDKCGCNSSSCLFRPIM